MITLAIFTLCEGYIVSFISSMTGVKSGNEIVLQAAFVTLSIILFIYLVVVIVCTIYAIYTK